MDDEGFEPSTFRMQNGRSTTELNARPPIRAGMRSAGAGCRLQTCRRGDPQRFNSAFPAFITFGSDATVPKWSRGWT